MSDLVVAGLRGDEEMVEAPVRAKRQYAAPQIVHELEMETRAGSPIMPLSVDPSNGQIQNPWDPDYHRR